MKKNITNKFLNNRSLTRAFLFTFLTFSLNVKAQNYPEQILLSTVNYQPYQSPSGSLPGYLEPFTENLSGSTITRISDKDVFGTTSQKIRHNYAKDQTWNSDGTLIKLAGYPAAILDGETFEFLYWRDIPSYGRWANTEPNYMYGTPGNNFVKFNVLTNTKVTLRSFDEYDSIDFGFGEGNQSNDDKYVGIIGKNGSNRTLVVYNIHDDVIEGTKDIGSSGDLDWFSVSQSGNFAVAMWRAEGSGPTQGVKSYDINMQNERHIHNVTEHADLGIDTNGNDVLVSYQGASGWDQGSYIYSARLDGGGVTNLFEYPGGIWGGHISCRNTDRPGWAYISEQCCTDHDVASREIFAIKLDGSGIIERYTKHHNDVSPGNGHSTMAVPNRDGTKILFASNWDDSSIKSDPNPPAWILEYPQESLSVTENEVTTENTVKVYPNPVTDVVNIKLSGQNTTLATLQLHDILGRMLVNKKIENESSASLNISSYPTGVYLLTMDVNGKKVTKKIIKE
ncbi:T9SS type A sorting domain-containing protein [Oceanihabitans sediminis]|uniref:T9SS C-terminal target domain-containing protein n=1 Tax=Oceanihabitans sediminis TaxID=1812012 RepID=A0A368P5S2_9FLAO|nr:T9SS type A sorting domain-containing protein [Oceanihabitans sediminis]MDX1277200.1 T9SS type A sorting domain-containing protein [Oceanihabitans sediminis]MDX1773619.1 T9SS type A sorting domain-containing protein [Oceanihabitans sediminis]RBP33062.1 putative secreted protein (Por secretion system target) [Oceanihabitans sediminis]RCU57424.1 T9SS C-terminal target domain-containing protein [Oceanihabitans sediminis]